MNNVLKRSIIIFIIAAIAGLVFGGAIASTANNTKPVDAQAQQKTNEKTVTETKKESIGYNTTTVEDASLEYGKTVTRTEGSYGEKTYTYSVKYKDDKEVSRELVKEEIAKKPIDKVIAKGTKIVWHCIDVTSYNQNAYDDNKCTSSTGEVRYTSDSQAIALDPSYSPGKSGAYYYNNK